MMTTETISGLKTYFLETDSLTNISVNQKNNYFSRTIESKEEFDSFYKYIEKNRKLLHYKLGRK